MNFYRRIGELVLGTRLKRISERFLADVSKIYKMQGIAFEPSWFPFFYLLKERKQTTLRAIADELEISHSAVSQLVTALEKRKLVMVIPDEQDKRQKLVCFTEEGEHLLQEVEPVWDAIEKGMEQLMASGHYMHYLIPAVDELEDAMANEGVLNSIKSAFDIGLSQLIKVRQLTTADYGFFENLVKNWQQDFPADFIYPIHLLSQWKEHPEQSKIVLAELNGQPVGFLQHRDDEQASELACLYVNGSNRRKRVASSLLEYWAHELEQRAGETKMIASVEKKSTIEFFLSKSGFMRKIKKADMSAKEKLSSKVIMQKVITNKG